MGVVQGRSIAPENEFHALRDNYPICEDFAAQDASFTRTGILLKVSESIEGHWGDYESADEPV